MYFKNFGKFFLKKEIAMKKIGIIGDSIAHGFYDENNLGWVARLAQKMLQKKSGEYVFNNMSQAGDNIADASFRATAEALSRSFDVIIVNIGINDLRRRKDSNLETDISEGARVVYWNRLLDTLNKTNAKIIVTDLIPVIENRYTEKATLIRRNEDVEKYNQIIANICKERNITFFARYHNWKNRNLEVLYKDANHPNAKGHEILADELFDFLQKIGI